MKRISLRLLVLTSLGAGVVGLAPMVERASGGPRGVPQSCDSELVEEIRIGTLTGAAEYSFSDVGSISIGADGTLYVSDMDLESIREFDSEGRFVREIGRQGEGPGEFRSLAMTDVRYGYARVSPDGVVLDTLLASDAPGAETAQSIAIHTPAGDRSPFPVDMLDALSPLGYLVAGFNATYAFSILDPAGLVDVEREGFQPVDVKAGERAEWRARVVHAERRSKTSFREVPARKPAYRGLWVDSEGRVWVHRYVEAVKRDEPIPELWLDDPEGTIPRITWAEPSLHDVYGPDGRLLHCVVVPDDAELVASRGSVVWGIVRGVLAEEYVVRWRIE